MNYYPFHIGDYLSATRHLTWEEDAAYRRLLDTYYTTEKPLPADLRACCRLVMASTESQREAVRVVLEEFFEATEEGWRNSRADAEIETMRDKQQKQRDKANKRWQKPAAEPGIASALPQHPETHAAASKSDADAMPPTPTPTPTPTPKEKRESAQPASRGQRLPQGWIPEPVHMAFAEGQGLRNGKANAELEKFRDYWAAQPGQKGVKTDWPATWRNWVRRAVENAAGKPSTLGAVDFEGVH